MMKENEMKEKFDWENFIYLLILLNDDGKIINKIKNERNKND